jgi:hypothetical protein
MVDGCTHAWEEMTGWESRFPARSSEALFEGLGLPGAWSEGGAATHEHSTGRSSHD